MTEQQNTNKSGTSKLVTDLIIGVVVLGLAYYGYTLFSSTDSSVSIVDSGASMTQFLGPNLTTFSQMVTKDKVTFNYDFLNKTSSFQDFTETINETSSRGRTNPFTPYASSRSSN